jgi:cob(I)alamin adenosyltransferase
MTGPGTTNHPVADAGARRREPQRKIVLVAGETPWNGVLYTTRDGRRRAYSDPIDLIRHICELTGWALPGAEGPLRNPRERDHDEENQMIQRGTERQTCADALDEANAAIGAGISTGELPPAADQVLRSIQRDLADMSRSLGRPGEDLSVVLPEEVNERPRAAALLLSQNRRPSGSLVAGHCLAAGLLRLARAVVIRAARSADALRDEDGRTAMTAYLLSLAALLDLVAQEADEVEERSIPVGTCIGDPAA